MQLKEMKILFAAIWISTLGAIGFFTATTTFGWISVVLLALLPPLVVAHRWRVPAQTISQSIQDARR